MHLLSSIQISKTLPIIVSIHLWSVIRNFQKLHKMILFHQISAEHKGEGLSKKNTAIDRTLQSSKNIISLPNINKVCPEVRTTQLTSEKCFLLRYFLCNHVCTFYKQLDDRTKVIYHFLSYRMKLTLNEAIQK